MNNTLSSVMGIVLPLAVVFGIFMVMKLSRENYDFRFLEPQQTTAIVIKKGIKPAGTTPMYRAIGGVIRAIPVTNQEEPTLFININGNDSSTVVSHSYYEKIQKGDSISVTYYIPKYWGKPFAVTLN